MGGRGAVAGGGDDHLEGGGRGAAVVGVLPCHGAATGTTRPTAGSHPVTRQQPV